MAKKTRMRHWGVLHVLETRRSEANNAIALRLSSDTTAAGSTVARDTADPTGACRYADGFGQMQCESPVTKSYCDGKSGFFTPDGRC
jgi:hypothetical protein